jgi:type II secretory pathway pseudopilin PulG
MNSKTIIIVVILLIAAFFGYQYLENKKEKERIEAQRIIEEEQRLQREDDLAWENATSLNTISSYQNYTTNQPSGDYEMQANERIEALKEEQRLIELQRKRTALAFTLAQKAGDLIIKKAYQDGINKHTQVDDWRYEPKGNYGTYDIAVTMSWNGNIFSSNYYNAQGIITIDDTGGNLKWKPTYMNPRLTKYIEDFNGGILGTVIAIGAINALQDQ